MKQILVVGAGREGKGYLGEVFCQGGWHVTFLDADAQVIQALQTGAYEVREYRADATVVCRVSGYDAITYEDTAALSNAVMAADIIAFCLYPGDIANALDRLMGDLKKRAFQCPQKPLALFPCTNENRLIPQMRSHIMNAFTPEEQQWLQKNVTLSDAIVRRPVGAQSSASLSLEAGVVCPMLVGEPVCVDMTGVPWMQTCSENMEILKDLKVHTINTAHAATAYAGYQKGYQFIDQAKADPEIQALNDGVLAESVPVLAKVFGVSEKSLWDLAVFPDSKDAFCDPIVRVAYDPLRKLSRHDRLTENAVLCRDHGVDPHFLIYAMACGMAYDFADDPAAQKIKELIQTLGINAAIARVTQLDENDELTARVAEEWRKITKKQCLEENK